MPTNTSPIESYEQQGKEWLKTDTDAAVSHHDEVLSQSEGAGETPIVVEDGVPVDPKQLMRDAFIAHRENAGQKPPTPSEAKNN